MNGATLVAVLKKPFHWLNIRSAATRKGGASLYDAIYCAQTNRGTAEHTFLPKVDARSRGQIAF